MADSEPPPLETVSWVYLYLLARALILLQPREIREYLVFMELLKMCPGLEDRLVKGDEEETELVADLVCHRFCSLSLFQPALAGPEGRKRSSRR